MPAKGFQFRSMHPHPDRSMAFEPKAEPQATSWWLCRPDEFYAKARTEQARMVPTLWNAVITKTPDTEK